MLRFNCRSCEKLRPQDHLHRLVKGCVKLLHHKTDPSFIRTVIKLFTSYLYGCKFHKLFRTLIFANTTNNHQRRAGYFANAGIRSEAKQNLNFMIWLTLQHLNPSTCEKMLTKQQVVSCNKFTVGAYSSSANKGCSFTRQRQNQRCKRQTDKPKKTRRAWVTLTDILY